MSVLPNYKLEYEKQPQDELKEIAKDHAKDLYEFVQDGLEANSEEVMLAIHAPEDTLIGQYTRSLILQVDTSQDYYNYGYQIIINGFETEVARYFEDVKDAEDGILNALEYYLQEKTDYYQIYNDLIEELREDLEKVPEPEYGSIDKNKINFYLDLFSKNMAAIPNYLMRHNRYNGEVNDISKDTILLEIYGQFGSDRIKNQRDPFLQFCRAEELAIEAEYITKEKKLTASIGKYTDNSFTPSVKNEIIVDNEDKSKLKAFMKDLLKKAIYKYDFDKYLKESKIRKMRSRRMFKEATNKVISYDDWQEYFNNISSEWGLSIAYLSEQDGGDVVHYDAEFRSEEIFGNAEGIWIAGYGKAHPENYDFEPLYGEVSVGIIGGSSPQKDFDGGFKEENYAMGSAFEGKLENALLQMLKKEFGIVVEGMEHAYTESRLRSRSKRRMVREDKDYLNRDFILASFGAAIEDFYTQVGFEYTEEGGSLVSSTGYDFMLEDDPLFKKGLETIAFSAFYSLDDVDNLVETYAIINDSIIIPLGAINEANIAGNRSYMSKAADKIFRAIKKQVFKESRVKKINKKQLKESKAEEFSEDIGYVSDMMTGSVYGAWDMYNFEGVEEEDRFIELHEFLRDYNVSEEFKNFIEKNSFDDFMHVTIENGKIKINIDANDYVMTEDFDSDWSRYDIASEIYRVIYRAIDNFSNNPIKESKLKRFAPAIRRGIR